MLNTELDVLVNVGGGFHGWRDWSWHPHWSQEGIVDPISSLGGGFVGLWLLLTAARSFFIIRVPQKVDHLLNDILV